MTTLVPRVALGYIIALPFIIPLTARSVGHLHSYVVAVTMTSRTQGHLQVFYDRGAGFSEARSTTVVLQQTGEPHEYRLGLPAGSYRGLRIDPGTIGGRYVIARVAILAPDGRPQTAIPLSALDSTGRASIVERAGDRLVVEAPTGPSDPALIYRPEVPIVIPRLVPDPLLMRLLVSGATLWFCGIVVVWLVERTLSRWGSKVLLLIGHATAVADRRPRAAICLAAALATLASTYPALLLGRSLVSPNNFGVPLLYDWVPFTPGSTDTSIEDVRGSDVAAALLQTVPHSMVQREALAAGEVPLWNRYNGAGRPLWSQGLTFLLDPLHWLALVTPDPALGWDLKLLMHRFVFAVGVGLVAMAATGAWLPAIVAAVAAPFGGIYLYRLNHPAIFVLTYAPWVLLAWLQLAAAASRRRLALALSVLVVSSSLVLLASSPKEAAVTLLALETTGAAAVVFASGSWRDRASKLLGAAMAGGAAILITTPHWLMFFQSLRDSFTAYDTPSAFFGGRSQAVGFFLGPLTTGPVQPGLHLLALVLTIAALAAPASLLRHSFVRACAVCAAVLAAIAFGAVPASWLLQVPLVSSISHIHDVFLTAALPLLMVLLAAGAGVLLSVSGRRVIVIVAMAGVVSWWLVANVGMMARDDGFEPWAVLLAVPVVLVLPACFYAARVSAQPLPALAAAGAAVAVLLIPSGLHAQSGIEPLDQLLLQPRPRTALTGRSSAIDALHRASAEPFRTVGLDSVLFSGSQALYGLEGIGGADPLEVRRYRELVEASGIFRSMVWFTTVTPKDVARLAPLLDMLNVGFVIARLDVVVPEFLAGPLSSDGRVRIERRTTAWPRAFFVEGLTSYQDPHDLLDKVADAEGPFAAIQAGDGDLVDIVSGDGRLVFGKTLGSSAVVIPGERYTLTANTTSFHVRTVGPGVAVLSETYLPRDFRASVNGRRVPYFRVNHAFKAVAIPSAGDWQVRFEYWPHRWTTSLVMTGLGILLLAGFVVPNLRAQGAP